MCVYVYDGVCICVCMCMMVYVYVCVCMCMMVCAYVCVQSILSNSPPVGKGSLGGLLERMDY